MGWGGVRVAWVTVLYFINISEKAKILILFIMLLKLTLSSS